MLIMQSHSVLTQANPSHDFSNISMTPKSRLLQEVIVSGEASQMKIKGNRPNEFNGQRSVIKPNAIIGGFTEDCRASP